jgi:hypothetical protein
MNLAKFCPAKQGRSTPELAGRALYRDAWLPSDTNRLSRAVFRRTAARERITRRFARLTV